MPNILVVEDDKDLNSAYCMILKIAHHTIESAFDGQEALDKLERFEPDLILLDLLMPIKSGLDFLQQFDVTKHPNTKLIIFTNLDNSPEIHEAFKLGADQCIVKAGTSPAGLIEVVNSVLSQKSKKASRAKQQA
jgi:two-component system response regulator AdeR